MSHSNIERIKIILAKSEEYFDRYDIPQEVYDDLIKECTAIDKDIEVDPEKYGSIKEANQLQCDCKLAIFTLMLRVSEMLENSPRST